MVMDAAEACVWPVTGHQAIDTGATCHALTAEWSLLAADRRGCARGLKDCMVLLTLREQW